MSKVSNKEVILWALILGVGAAIIYTGVFDGHGSELAGKPAPALVFQDAKGAVTELKDLKGSVVILNVYATWCPPCRREIPEFAQYYRHVAKDPGVKLFGVVYESGDPDTAVKKSRAMGVTYPIFMGDRSLTTAFGLHTYPSTIVIDANGLVRAQITGTVDYADLEKLVADAMVPIDKPATDPG